MVAQYDVFINHRGPDSKETIVSHLYGALSRAGYRPFVDNSSLEHGSRALDEIDRALRGASVHVAVLSKRYGESPYCLDELGDMLQSGKTVLPVFHDVEPGELRSFGESTERPFEAALAQYFKQHNLRDEVEKGKIAEEKIARWSEALRGICELMGSFTKKLGVTRNEYELVMATVSSVRAAMPAKTQEAKSARFGLQESLRAVLKELDSMNDYNVGVVSLFGVGGIGKTTLALEVYNSLVSSRQCEYCCFLKNVRSAMLSKLQNQLLLDLAGNHQSSSDEYQQGLNGLSRRRILLVIDDIDDVKQFTDLVPDFQKLGPGSRILVTSRDVGVLEKITGPAVKNSMYEVKQLSCSDSRELFNWHAFSSMTPKEGFGDLAATVADACRGHPLTLEVIGAMLSEMQGPDDTVFWTEALNKLKENETVFGRLRVSYDCLTEGEKAMFRDVACLMDGLLKDIAMVAWKSCDPCSRLYCSTSKDPSHALLKLTKRSLVKEESGRVFVAHDVLLDMGREIVVLMARSEPEKITHLWDSATVSKMLRRIKKKVYFTRGINLSTKSNNDVVSCKASTFEYMPELHFLVLDGFKIDPDDFSNWPEELRWLRWESEPQGENLPSELDLPKLVVLDLSRNLKLTRLWQDGADIKFPSLQMLFLHDSLALKELPQNIGSSLPQLKMLDMEGCGSIESLPDSIGQLKQLEHVNLSRVFRLSTLPNGFVELINLKSLNLAHCRSLEELPMEFGRLSKLEELHLSNCRRLRTLPPSLGGLKMLKTLEMLGTEVRELPVDFGGLSRLQSLYLAGLQSVPESFNELQALAYLCVGAVHSDVDGRMISALEALKGLVYLRLPSHPTITSLPSGIKNLERLVLLEMYKCPELQIVEALPPGLHHLDFHDCSKLTEIAPLSEMRSLEFLSLRNCTSLRHVRGLENLEELKDVNLSGCTSVQDCQPLGMQKSRALRVCYVNGCKIGATFDNRWLEREPALHHISYYGNAIGFLPNGMRRQVVVNRYARREGLMEAIISSKAECVALMLCFVAHIKDWHWYTSGDRDVEVEIWRRNMRRAAVQLPIRESSDRNQVYLYTLRREHHVVRALEHGDEIRVFGRHQNDGGVCYTTQDFTVVEAAVCVVHQDGEQLVFSVNSELLCSSSGEDFARRFDRLKLADDA